MAKSVWELFLKDTVSSRLDALNGLANKTSKAFVNAQDRINKMSDSIHGMSSEIRGLSRGVELMNNPLVLAGAGIAVVGTGLYKATSLAMDYEQKMAKINATAQLSRDGLSKLKDQLKEIGSSSSGNFERIPDAFEKILSQTGDVNMSLDILRTSVKGAKAGFTDIDMVAGAVAQTLSVVGEQNTTGQEVMDTLLMAKGVGAGEFSDFAQYLPQLIAAGANLNVAFKDTAGLFSYMTAKGQSAADSTMLIQNAFTALQKDTVISGLGKKGIELFNLDGSRKNIQEVFTSLGDKLKGLTDKQKTKFFIDIGLNDAQAKNAFSVLTSDGEKFKSIMGDVNNALGETNRQLDKTANSSRNWGDLKDELLSIGETIGNALLPMADKLVSVLSGAVKSTSDLIESGRIHNPLLMAQEEMAARLKYSSAGALEHTKFKFGDKMYKEDGTLTQDAYSFYKLSYKQILDGFAGKKIPDASSTSKVFGTAKNVFNAGNEGKDGGKPFGSSTSKSIDTISAGGKNVRNVTVSINKLVESLIIKAGTVNESALELENKVKEIMLRAIQGSEIALSNG